MSSQLQLSVEIRFVKFFGHIYVSKIRVISRLSSFKDRSHFLSISSAEMKNQIFQKCLYVVVPYRYFGIRESLLMEKYSHWLSQPYLCDFVFSNHSNHLEFQVILCEIPSEIISADTVAPTSQSTWTFPETIKIQNNYHENTFLPQTTKICSLGISHGITWNSKWNAN